MAKILQLCPIMTLDISSTVTGAAAYYRGHLVTGKFDVRHVKDYSRICEMGDMFLGWFSEQVYAPHILGDDGPFPVGEHVGWDVWVEHPFYSKGGSIDLPIKMAHGALLYCMHILQRQELLHFSWNFVTVSEWRKKFKLGRDVKDKKRPVMESMAKRFGIEVTDDNIGDALGILDWRIEQIAEGGWI